MKNKKVVAVVGILLAIMAVAAVAIVFLLRGKSSEPETYVMDEGNYQQIKAEMDEQVSEGYFETYMNTDWTFENGTAETKDAVFGNSPNNTKPIRCEVVLDDTGEIVFKSKVLPVGAELGSFKLDKDLEAGIYNAVCQIYLMDEGEDGRYVDSSSAGFHITITVNN